jgi:hypothetical protein
LRRCLLVADCASLVLISKVSEFQSHKFEAGLLAGEFGPCFQEIGKSFPRLREGFGDSEQFGHWHEDRQVLNCGSSGGEADVPAQCRISERRCSRLQ